MVESIRDHSGIELVLTEGKLPDEVLMMVHDTNEPIIALEVSLDKQGVDWLLERLQKLYPDG